MDERRMKDQCSVLFSGSKGKAALSQARRELQFLRAGLPASNILRFNGEFAFYRMRHTISSREFRKRYDKQGPPQYAWDINNCA